MNAVWTPEVENVAVEVEENPGTIAWKLKI
jgi:hypothetical protein